MSESCEKNMRMHIYLYLCAYELVCVCAHTQTRYSEQTVEQRSGAKRRAQPSGKRRVQRRRNQGRGVLVELGEQARHSPALAGSSAPCASTASAPCPACLPHSLGWRWGVLFMELLQEICHRRPCAHAKCQQVCRRQCEQGCRGQGLPWPITCPNDPVHPIPRPRLRHGLLTLCLRLHPLLFHDSALPSGNFVPLLLELGVLALNARSERRAISSSAACRRPCSSDFATPWYQQAKLLYEQAKHLNQSCCPEPGLLPEPWPRANRFKPRWPTV